MKLLKYFAKRYLLIGSSLAKDGHIIFAEMEVNFLILSDEFDQNINCYPESLNYLEFGEYFNKPINNLPDNLQILIFGMNFNQPVHKKTQ